MKREILFRGKTKSGDWFFGDLEHIEGYIYVRAMRVIPETVGQYMGLKDKNGVKILEGDIVRDNFGNIGVITYLEHFAEWRIRFYKGREDLLCELGVGISSWVYPKMMLEVIGNIHDNPELLQAN